jgi:hypothetical protein
MRFSVTGFRVFRQSRAAPPSGAAAAGGVPADLPLPPPPPLLASGEGGIGHPTAESQRAGLEHLIRVAREQAAGR